MLVKIVRRDRYAVTPAIFAPFTTALRRIKDVPHAIGPDWKIGVLQLNAAKYGPLSDGKGRVEVTWSCAAGGQLSVRWTERGGPPVETPTREGFGTHIVGRIVREQLKGEMRLDWNPAGLECEIVLPITSNSNLVTFP
jgi:hypothetical protein